MLNLSNLLINKENWSFGWKIEFWKIPWDCSFKGDGAEHDGVGASEAGRLHGVQVGPRLCCRNQSSGQHSAQGTRWLSW